MDRVIVYIFKTDINSHDIYIILSAWQQKYAIIGGDGLIIITILLKR